ncbi:hypothetical protein K388_05828 [Streptomyces sp. KhCrAH-43]|uniref:hypothetical protein n=1 Tax=unclassified Streptomyces TaxID=2593676 RepID=UPI000373C571|nr:MULTISPECIES: hypothetical protein [unclassified Streptomyces]MYS33497.1 hypothetical protein [Streptomyces sp. SID4920]MYX63911.1 hypothetical protein [Streptomyces sp. SID8373]RAJ52729.1 hypothetical protein K388_05828 [Streptomyces sp. KhCrAH-43]
MRFLITDDSRQILTAIDVPDAPEGDSATIGIERADRPDLLYVGADLYNDGAVVVGHWPDGEHWDRLVRSEGVLDSCGHATPAHPAEPTYTRAQVIAALASVRTRLAPNEDPSAAETLIRATLDSLTAQTG